MLVLVLVFRWVQLQIHQETHQHAVTTRRRGWDHVEGRSVLGLLAGGTRAIGPAWAQTDDWAKAVEARPEEGKRVSTPPRSARRRCKGGHQGLRAEVRHHRSSFLEARASEGREQVRVEQSAGRFLGDVHHNGSTTTWLMHPRRQLPAARPDPQHQEHRAALRGRRHPHPGRGHQLPP